MKTLYLDCFAGISGDMLLGAIIDLGVSPGDIFNQLESLGVHSFRLEARKILKNGISGTKADVHLSTQEHHHRHLSDIVGIINNSCLPEHVKTKGIAVFTNLGEAEAKIHGVPLEQIHFHEVGAVDAIVDILGTLVGLDILGIEHLVCSPLPLGAGFINSAHGLLPLPAPAALELLRDLPTRTCDILGETVTPTGAAVIKTLCSDFGLMPSMIIHSVGYGAGSADRDIPNLLRAVLGNMPEPDASLERDCLNTIEANIDDMNPEFYEHLFPLLLANGAVDVFLTPVIMKKSRPAHILTCLVEDANMQLVINTLLAETTTLGVRTSRCSRYKLSRKVISVNTAYGEIGIKLGLHPKTGEILNIAPEWEQCKTLAQRFGIPAKTVYDLAKIEGYKKVNQ